MEPHISNILRGTRQFFQGVPASSADSVSAPAGWSGPLTYTSAQRPFAADPAAGRPPWPPTPERVPPATPYAGYPAAAAERRRAYWDAPPAPPPPSGEHVVMVMDGATVAAPQRAALQAALRQRVGAAQPPPPPVASAAATGSQPWPRPPHPAASVSTELSGLYDIYGRKQHLVTQSRQPQQLATAAVQQLPTAAGQQLPTAVGQQLYPPPPRAQIAQPGFPMPTPLPMTSAHHVSAVTNPHASVSGHVNHRQSPSAALYAHSLPSHRDAPASAVHVQRESSAAHRQSAAAQQPPPAPPRQSPSTHQLPPTTSRPASMRAQSQPGHLLSSAVLSQFSAPQSHRQSPAARTQSPAAHRQSPAAHGQPPGSRGQSPAAHRQSPGSRGQSPAAHRQSPAAHSQSPGSRGQSPAAHRQSPAAHSQSTVSRGLSPAAHGYSRPSSAQGRSEPAAMDPSPAPDAAKVTDRRPSTEGQLLDLRPIDTGQPRKRLSSEVLDLSVKSREQDERPHSAVPGVSQRSITPQQRPESVPPRLSNSWSTPAAAVGNGALSSKLAASKPASSDQPANHASGDQGQQGHLVIAPPQITRPSSEAARLHSVGQPTPSGPLSSSIASSEGPFLQPLSTQIPPSRSDGSTSAGFGSPQQRSWFMTAAAPASGPPQPSSSPANLQSRQSPALPRPDERTAATARSEHAPVSVEHLAARSNHSPARTNPFPSRSRHSSGRSDQHPARTQSLSAGHVPQALSRPAVPYSTSQARSIVTGVGAPSYTGPPLQEQSAKPPASSMHAPFYSPAYSAGQSALQPPVSRHDDQRAFQLPSQAAPAYRPQFPPRPPNMHPPGHPSARHVSYPSAYPSSMPSPSSFPSSSPQRSSDSSVPPPHYNPAHVSHPSYRFPMSQPQPIHSTQVPAARPASVASSTTYPPPPPPPPPPPNGPARSALAEASAMHQEHGVKRSHGETDERPGKVSRCDEPEPDRRRPLSGELTEASSLEEILRLGILNGAAGHSPQDLAQMFPNMAAASSPEKPAPPPPAARELDIYQSVTSFINDNDPPEPPSPPRQYETLKPKAASQRPESGASPPSTILTPLRPAQSVSASSRPPVLSAAAARPAVLTATSSHHQPPQPDALQAHLPHAAAPSYVQSHPAALPFHPPHPAAPAFRAPLTGTESLRSSHPASSQLRPAPSSVASYQPPMAPQVPPYRQPYLPPTAPVRPPPPPPSRHYAPQQRAPAPGPAARPSQRSPRAPRPAPEPLQVAGAPVEFRRARGPFLTPDQERCLQSQLWKYERQIRQVATDSLPSSAAGRVRTKAELKSPTAVASEAKPPRQSTSTESNKSVFDFDSGSDGEVPVLSHKTQVRPAKPEPPKVDVFGDSLESSFWEGICDSLAENIHTNQKLVKSKKVTRSKIASKLQQISGREVKSDPDPSLEEPERLTPLPGSSESKPEPINGESTSEIVATEKTEAADLSSANVKLETELKQECSAEDVEKPAKVTPTSDEALDSQNTSKQAETVKREDTGSEYELSNPSAGEGDESSRSSSSSEDSSSDSSQQDSSDDSEGGGSRRRPASRRRAAAVDSDSGSEVEVRRRRRRARAFSSASSSSARSRSGSAPRRRRRSRSADGDGQRRLTRSRGGRRLTRQSRQLVLGDALPKRRRRAAKQRAPSQSGSDAEQLAAAKPRRDAAEGGRWRGRPARRSVSAERSRRTASSSARRKARMPASTTAADASSPPRKRRPGRPSKQEIAARTAKKVKSPEISDDDETTPGRDLRPDSQQVLHTKVVLHRLPSDEDTTSRSVADLSRPESSMAAAKASSSVVDDLPSLMNIQLPRLIATDVLDHYHEDHCLLLQRIAEVLARQTPRARFPRIRMGGAHLWSDDWPRLFIEWKTAVCRVPERLVTPPRQPEQAPPPEPTPPNTPRKSAARRDRAIVEATTQLAFANTTPTADADAKSGSTDRFVIRQAAPSAVDLIESRLMETVRKTLAPAQSQDRSQPESIVTRLMYKYGVQAEKPDDRRSGCTSSGGRPVFHRSSSILHYTQPTLLATPCSGGAAAADPAAGGAPPPPALQFRPETVQRFAAELAGCRLADATAGAAAVVLDSRTRGARAHLTETELLREVFGVERHHLLQKKTSPQKTSPGRPARPSAPPTPSSPSVDGAPATPGGPGPPPRLPRARRRRNKNRSSGFDFMLKRRRRRDVDAEPTTRNKRHLAADGPRMGADVTGSGALAAEVHSWALNRSAGETALLRASKLGYLDAVIYLLESGEESVRGCRDHASFTPLHEACARGHLDVAKTLLLYGADVNVSAKGGVRPLHEAVENNHPEVVRLLLGYGSDPLLPTYKGLSPLELASGMATMTTLLRGHIDDVEGTTGGGWRLPAASVLERRPSGLDLWRHAPPYLPRPDDTHLTFDLAATPLPDIYRCLRDTSGSSSARYVTLSSLARHLRCASEAELVRQYSHLHVLQMDGPAAAALVCQTLSGWRLRLPPAQTVTMVRMDRDVEALLQRDRFNMAV